MVGSNTDIKDEGVTKGTQLAATCCECWGGFGRGSGQRLQESLIVEVAAGPGHCALLLTGESLRVKHQAGATALLPSIAGDAEIELGAVCDKVIRADCD